MTVSRQVREDILRKFGNATDDEKAFRDRVARTAALLCIDEHEAIEFLQAVRTPSRQQGPLSSQANPPQSG